MWKPSSFDFLLPGNIPWSDSSLRSLCDAGSFGDFLAVTIRSALNRPNSTVKRSNVSWLV